MYRNDQNKFKNQALPPPTDASNHFQRFGLVGGGGDGNCSGGEEGGRTEGLMVCTSKIKVDSSDDTAFNWSWFHWANNVAP